MEPKLALDQQSWQDPLDCFDINTPRYTTAISSNFVPVRKCVGAPGPAVARARSWEREVGRHASGRGQVLQKSSPRRRYQTRTGRRNIVIKKEPQSVWPARQSHFTLPRRRIRAFGCSRQESRTRGQDHDPGNTSHNILGRVSTLFVPHWPLPGSITRSRYILPLHPNIGCASIARDHLRRFCRWEPCGWSLAVH